MNDLFVDAPSHDPGGKTRYRMPTGWKVEAEFNGPGKCYRTKLSHRWADGPMIIWCLMNPSTADYKCLDPTVAKTARISKRLGFGGQYIANACAYRATDRIRLLEVDDPVGPSTHAALIDMARASSLIVVAHGRLPGNLQCHADAMTALLRAAGHKLHVLRLTGDGVPVHPLARGKAHIPEDIQPVLWP